MTITEAEDFYRRDDKRYELKENKNFVDWLKYQIKNGYKPQATISDLQQLIDDIALWYELKYPNRVFDQENGIKDPRFINFDSEMKNLDIKELFYRLSNKELSILECNYRGNHYSLINRDPSVVLHIFSKIETDGLDILKPQSFLVYVNTLNGIIDEYEDIEEYYNDMKLEYFNYNKDENMHIEKFYASLVRYQDDLDLHELEECIQNNKIDILLRKYLLRLVPLKLLYSKNTIPEYGYLRAKRFMNEFSAYYLSKNVNLDFIFDEIDIIMNKNNKILVK